MDKLPYSGELYILFLIIGRYVFASDLCILLHESLIQKRLVSCRVDNTYMCEWVFRWPVGQVLSVASADAPCVACQ